MKNKKLFIIMLSCEVSEDALALIALLDVTCKPHQPSFNETAVDIDMRLMSFSLYIINNMIACFCLV